MSVRAARVCRRILLAVVIIIIIAAPGSSAARAHHGFPLTYDLEAPQIRIEGEIVRLAFRNPHSFIYVDAPDASGERRTWSVEWGSVLQLGERGLTRSTLRLGDRVIITGHPGRPTPRPDYKLLMRTLLRPSDGLSWEMDIDRF